MAHELVINAPHRMCCGLPSAACNCHTPQRTTTTNVGVVPSRRRMITLNSEPAWGIEDHDEDLLLAPVINYNLPLPSQGALVEVVENRGNRYSFEDDLLIPPTIDFRALGERGALISNRQQGSPYIEDDDALPLPGTMNAVVNSRKQERGQSR